MPFLAVLVGKLINIYSFLLLVRIILSWVRVDYRNAWVRLLVKLTDPFLDPFRRLIPPIGGIDFSPILAFMVLNMLGNVLVRFLSSGF